MIICRLSFFNFNSFFSSELENEGKMYRNGFDHLDRPLLYMKPGNDNTGTKEKEEKVKYLVYLMEKCILAAYFFLFFPFFFFSQFVFLETVRIGIKLWFLWIIKERGV